MLATAQTNLITHMNKAQQLHGRATLSKIAGAGLEPATPAL